MPQLVQPSQLSDNVIAGLNAAHSMWGGSFPHNDGPTYDVLGVKVGLSLSAISTAEAAVTGIQNAAAFLNLHFAAADLASGDRIFAHNQADGSNVISGTMSAWSTYEATLREAARLVLNDCSAKYEAHRTNTGGTYHTAVDGTNYLGAPALPSLGTTDQMLCERATLLAKLVSDHVVLTSGSVHGASDASHAITAPNAIYSSVTGCDWDKLITLTTQIRTNLNAHILLGSATHAAADSNNAVTVAAMSYPAGIFSLVGEIGTKYELHRVLMPAHNFADTLNVLSFSNPVTTIAAMVAAAEEIRVDVMAHVERAPISRAWKKTA